MDAGGWEGAESALWPTWTERMAASISFRRGHHYKPLIFIKFKAQQTKDQKTKFRALIDDGDTIKSAWFSKILNFFFIFFFSGFSIQSEPISFLFSSHMSNISQYFFFFFLINDFFFSLIFSSFTIHQCITIACYFTWFLIQHRFSFRFKLKIYLDHDVANDKIISLLHWN